MLHAKIGQLTMGNSELLDTHNSIAKKHAEHNYKSRDNKVLLLNQ